VDKLSVNRSNKGTQTDLQLLMSVLVKLCKSELQ
jgi:hypothetical protein